MLTCVFIPRAHAKPLTGWLLSDLTLPQHRIRFFRALLTERPTEAERAAIRAQAEDAERNREVRLEILVHRNAV